MAAPEWRLCTTLQDLPSAQLLAGVLADAGLTVRIASDAAVLGQAAPSRIYVAAAHYPRARRLLERQCSDEELTRLSLADTPGEDSP